jgi:hypothetical protein
MCIWYLGRGKSRGDGTLAHHHNPTHIFARSLIFSVVNIAWMQPYEKVKVSKKKKKQDGIPCEYLLVQGLK